MTSWYFFAMKSTFSGVKASNIYGLIRKHEVDQLGHATSCAFRTTN